MIIYGEYLFLENFITGIILIMFTLNAFHLQVPKWKLIIGGIGCGLFSFIIFLKIGWIIAILLKICFVMITWMFILHTFTDIKKVVRVGVIFIVISYAYGGLTVGAIYLMKETGITKNCSLYLDGLTYIQITVGITIAFFIGKYFIEIIKENRMIKRVFVDTKLYVDDHEFTFKGFIDSGNFLRDPIFGRPVIIADQVAAKKVVSIMQEKEKRYCLVPYKTIGSTTDFLEAYRIDGIIVRNQKIGRVIMAVYNGNFQNNLGESYNLLLHQDILERGL